MGCGEPHEFAQQSHTRSMYGRLQSLRKKKDNSYSKLKGDNPFFYCLSDTQVKIMNPNYMHVKTGTWVWCFFEGGCLLRNGGREENH